MSKKMRKILFPLLVLGIILGMSNCKEEPEDDPIILPPNPFIGTWRDVVSGYHDVFTANTITVYKTDKSIYWKATYTYDDTNVKVEVDAVLSSPEVVATLEYQKGLLPYIFYDGYLLLNTAQLEKCDYNFIP